MMKKFLLALILATAMLFIFTACNGNGDTVATYTSGNGIGYSELTEQPSPEVDNGILHQFPNLGFSFMLPATWEGKYGLVEWGTAESGNILLQIYHPATRAELGSEYVGTLFFLGKVMGEHYTADEPPMMSGHAIILAQANGYTYFLNFPGDIQWNMDDPESETTKEFLEMQNQYEFIVGSFNANQG